jgi:hypothetical protein
MDAPEHNPGSLQDALRRLEALLAERAPDIAGALRPGLSEQQIRGLITEIPHQLPESVSELYRWHDGTELTRGPFRAELFPDGQLLPLDEAVRLRAGAIEATRDNGVPAWHSAWLPLFTEGMKRFRVVTCGKPGGSVIFFDFVNLPRTITEYQRLEGLIDSLVRRWTAGAYWQGKYAGVEEDPALLARLLRAEDQEPVDVSQLVRELSEGSEGAHSKALYLLRTRRYPEAVPDLIRLISGGNGQGRIAAAELLGDLADPTACGPLQRAAEQDSNELVRFQARASLQTLGC